MAISSWIPPPPPDPNTLCNPIPFKPFPLSQLRAGKVKNSLGAARIESAIFKTPLSGPITITTNGIVGDEHAYEPHRSPDKAILHYCTAHYDAWREEIPASEHLFKAGAFGENIYNKEISEKTICIGDRIAIGDVIVEVSEPRTPCFKLNHRFEVRDMAKRAQTLLRTGWLYRIIKPGVVMQGDIVRLLDRPFPEWTVARVMYYLFLDTKDAEMMKQIVELGPLGEDVKGKFQARLTKGVTEDQDGRMFGGEEEKMDMWSEYRVVEKRKETRRVVAFGLEALEDVKVPELVQPGSHVRLKLGGKLVRAYSVIGGTSKHFELGIALDASSRGGSKYLHEHVTVGDVLTVGRIQASFPLAEDAREHIVIAGGIGITAFLAALQVLQDTMQNFHLHYAVSNEVPFATRITNLGATATIYSKSLGQQMDINAIISQAHLSSHIYACGPQRLLDAVQHAALQYGISKANIHIETFTVDTSGDPFTAKLKQSDLTIEIGPTQTLLDALKAVGMDIDSSCEVGNCGACRVDVCSGRIEHRGTGLLGEEKAEAMLSCVSRGVGTIELDL